MRKSISIITAAAMAASLTMVNAISAFADDSVVSSVSPTGYVDTQEISETIVSDGISLAQEALAASATDTKEVTAKESVTSDTDSNKKTAQPAAAETTNDEDKIPTGSFIDLNGSRVRLDVTKLDNGNYSCYITEADVFGTYYVYGFEGSMNYGKLNYGNGTKSLVKYDSNGNVTENTIINEGHSGSVGCVQNSLMWDDSDGSSYIFVSGNMDLTDTADSNKISKEDAEKKALDAAAKNGFTGIVLGSEYNANNGIWTVRLQRNDGTKRMEYQVSKNSVKAIDPDETAVTSAISKEEAEKKALDDAAKNGFTGVVVSSEYNANSGLWNVTLQRDGGTKRMNYQVSKDLIKAIDPDAQAVSGNAAVTSTSNTTTNTGVTSVTTTAKPAASNKNGNPDAPKTGVAFPAIPVAGLAMAGIVALFMKKRNK